MAWYFRSCCAKRGADCTRMAKYTFHASIQEAKSPTHRLLAFFLSSRFPCNWRAPQPSSYPGPKICKFTFFDSPHEVFGRSNRAGGQRGHEKFLQTARTASAAVVVVPPMTTASGSWRRRRGGGRGDGGGWMSCPIWPFFHGVTVVDGPPASWNGGIYASEGP